MADKSWKKNRNDRDLDRLFSELSESEQKRLEGVWDDQTDLEISKEETEKALSAVHQKLGLDDAEKPSSTVVPAKNRYPYILAAAILLLAFGIGFLAIGKTVYVPYGETASLELPDGSFLDLNSGTEIRYNRLFGYINRNIYLNGEAFFDVINDDIPFHVHSNRSIIEVTGTQFNVRSWKDDPVISTTVTVISGQVNFFSPDSPSEAVQLSEGLKSSISQDMNRPTDPEFAATEITLAWKDKNLAFLSQPLEEIFKELERKFDIKIEIADAEIGRSILTTFFSDPEDAESVLNDICTVKGLTYSESADGYRISFK